MIHPHPSRGFRGCGRKWDFGGRTEGAKLPFGAGKEEISDAFPEFWKWSLGPSVVHWNMPAVDPGEIPGSRGQEGENNLEKNKIIHVLIGRKVIFGFAVPIIDRWMGACGKL